MDRGSARGPKSGTSTNKSPRPRRSAEFPVFSCFSRLPPELREQIWYYALPHNAGSALCAYRRRNGVLPRSRLRIPIAYVNHEAYAVAKSWTCTQSAQDHGRDFTFALPFDPIRDAIYVTLDRYHNNFTSDGHPFIRGRQPSQADCVEHCLITQLAIPLTFLRDDLLPLQFLFGSHHNIKTLIIVMNSPSNEELERQRWEFEDLPGELMEFDHDTRYFAPKVNPPRRFRAIFKSIGGALHELCGTRSAWGAHLQVRAVLAVPR